MPKLNDDYQLIESPLAEEFRQDGISVDVLIYRGEEDASWVLEVVDQANNSYLWDDQFATDELAMNAFIASVSKGGMKQFNPHYKQREH